MYNNALTTFEKILKIIGKPYKVNMFIKFISFNLKKYNLNTGICSSFTAFIKQQQLLKKIKFLL